MSKPLHPRASALQRAGLFAGLKSFDELETRITALPDERARGGAFEVFAEAYLATQRRHDLPQVWPLAAVPTEVLRKLALPLNDYGVDGVAQTVLGGFDVYQVKFRSGRPPLTWRELSTFMGLADSAGIHSRVLFTNCDDLPAVMNERKGFFCIRGSDLDRLEESDFRAIESWLAKTQVPTARKQPLPHQHEALDVLLPALRQHDRVTGIMACATGKTLVALWIAENVAQAFQLAGSGDFPVASSHTGLESPVNPQTGMSAPRILVLLPSLALLRQTLHEWLHETSLPSLAYLCVCSDPTVKQDLDAIATPQSDLDFPVTTDRRSVREFLDAPFAGAKIIFSTYQSARGVGEALRKGETFDLGIFDEAHKTAGREGRNYAFALEDSNLPIRKRLFLTATPRHYNPLRKDKEGDAQLVFSMDNPQVYGKQAFRLTFAEAARRGIICNYKVVISVITSDMVTNELLSRSEVLVNGDPIRARQVANQLALTDAIAKYGVNKVFTFHRTVKSAESFVADGSEGIGTHLFAVAADVRRRISGDDLRLVTPSAANEFQTFHVNGTMPTARRERVMRDFREASRAVMSNARCLTEGVDVPAVDMVAFLSPRRSRVDIVQATGRAMRRSPGKTTGFVLVPLYVELAAAETVEAAVSRAEFDEVWDVLQSLQEQDEVLAAIIREMREERGRTKGFDDSRFCERIKVLGPELSLATLHAAIVTACIENLSPSWEEYFGQLSGFNQRFGHCNVPQRWHERPELARWVNKQRQLKKERCSSEERVRRLESLGFVWDIREAAWEEMFEALRGFKDKNGHCRVPSNYRRNPQLGVWVTNQRSKRNQLDESRRRRLDALEFVWDSDEAVWEEMFTALVLFKRQHDHCNVPQKWRQNKRLAGWIGTQRQLKKRGRLSAIRVKRLEKSGLVWSPVQTEWEKGFNALLDYRREHSNCNVPAKWRENSLLGAWVVNVRQAHKEGTLSPDRVRQLDAIGFTWNVAVSRWEQRFAELEAYRKEFGDCNVPPRWKKNPQIALWFRTQRRARQLGKLSVERTKRLESLGIIWEPADVAWEQQFNALAAFKAKHAHCSVPQGFPEDPKLGSWVLIQRQSWRKGTLSESRARRLEAIGFVRQPHEAYWEEMFESLVRFHARRGNCNVPIRWPENPKLGVWVFTQRRLRRTRKLDPARVSRLNQLGFTWDVRDVKWGEMHIALGEFKQAKGNCNVPAHWPQNPMLGKWVSRQRHLKKSGKLSAERTGLLDALGFRWEFAT